MVQNLSHEQTTLFSPGDIITSDIKCSNKNILVAETSKPFSQGVMLYRSFKKRGIPIRFLVLPQQPHRTIEPRMTVKVAETNLEWMLHYLQGKPKSF